MFKKIWETIIFLIILFISTYISASITYTIGKKYFDVFIDHCSKGSICAMNITPISIWSYPYNLLLTIFIILTTILVILFTYLILKYVIKEK